MKVLLIQAPCWAVYTPPYNLALLKAVVRGRGYQAKCLDLNIEFYSRLSADTRRQLYECPTNWYQENFVKQVLAEHREFFEESLRMIEKEQAQVIGFTASGLNSVFSKALAQSLKQNSPDCRIIFGGSYCYKSEFGQSLLNDCGYIDAVFYLEAEQSLPQYLDKVRQGTELSEIPGVHLRANADQVIYGPDPSVNIDINKLPFADYSDFDLTKYMEPELPLSTSRGCINRCLFCSESRVWNTYRSRNAENIYEEICFQLKQYPNIRSFYFNDSLINGNIAALEKLCGLLISGRTNISWGGQAAIRSQMTPQLIRKMRKAGLSHVSYGLETASNRILESIGKKFTAETAGQVIRETKKAGIRTDVNIVVGFPGETEQDIMRTAEFLKQNRSFIDEIFFHPLAITKGSGYFNDAENLGICFEDKWNPNSWYLKGRDNTLTKRLDTLEFYRAYIGRKGESFFTMPEYYTFVADQCFREKDYEKALQYYDKAQKTNSNKLKQETLRDKIDQARRLSASADIKG